VATPQAVLYEVAPLLVKPDADGTLESEGPTVLQIKELRADYVETVDTLFGADAGCQFDV
jgi:hypothetical protein